MKLFHATSPTEALRPDLGDRRFFALGEDPHPETVATGAVCDADHSIIAMLQAAGFFVRQRDLPDGDRPGVVGDIDDAIAFAELAAKRAAPVDQSAVHLGQVPHAYDIRDQNGDGCLRLAKDVDPRRLIAVTVTPLFRAAEKAPAQDQAQIIYQWKAELSEHWTDCKEEDYDARSRAGYEVRVVILWKGGAV